MLDLSSVTIHEYCVIFFLIFYFSYSNFYHLLSRFSCNSLPTEAAE